MKVKLARVVGGFDGNYGKIVTIVGLHPVAKGYTSGDGSIVQCQMWQVDPPINGFNGALYDAVPDEHLAPLDA